LGEIGLKVQVLEIDERSTDRADADLRYATTS